MFFKKNPEVVAAVDLGSNSFHMIVARVQQGQIHIIDTIKEMVRLGAGITPEHAIDEATTERAIACLQRFGQRLGNMHANHVRVVGTNALRRATYCDDFLQAAETALGHPIEVISGIEEARLIYVGVSHCLPTGDKKTLVIDIGGGSTELIIGQHHTPELLESLYMGCLAMSNRFFADGKITEKRFKKAGIAAHRELEPIANRYRKTGWDQTVGSSGTVRSINEYITSLGLPTNNITLEALYAVRDDLVKVGHSDNIKAINLPAERGPVFPGGLAVLIAVFEALQIKELLPSECALREGILHELTGTDGNQDIHSQTINNISQRYHVDMQHAGRVESCCRHFYQQVADTWDINKPHLLSVLSCAAQLHEVGLTISHSRYQLHGGYLIEYSDLPGFNRQEQREIAALIRLHRRKLKTDLYLNVFSEKRQNRLLKLSLLLRLAVILHRGRHDQPLPDIKLRAKTNELKISFPSKWLKKHPLTKGDLEDEAAYWQSINYQLRLTKHSLAK